MHGGTLAALVAAATLAIPAAAQADVPVSVGSRPSPFPQNKQNEPAVAVDPVNSSIVIGGSNDEIDEPSCDGSSCPFVQGIGNSGVYWSTDGGGSWTQPDYTGYSARTGAGGTEGALGTGLIGTLPNYDTAGLVSDGDPAVAWGPAPGPNGFNWTNGERAYYANLSANFASTKSDEAFKGYEAIAVSHTLNLANAIAGMNSGWSKPAIVSDTRQSSSTFSDKEAVWADNAATSKFFGNVYICWTDFRSATLTGNGNAPIMLSRSTDGGDTWSRGIQLTAAHNNASAGGRQGCDMRTDSAGNLYIFFSDSADKSEAVKEVRSTDGGKTIGKPQVVTSETNPGGPSVVRAGEEDNIDGVAGSRTDDFPHVSIANGAPTGEVASNKIALAWDDGGSGLGDEHIYLKMSADGTNWSPRQDLAESGDRPAMPSVALSPNGRDVYLVYSAFLDPFRWHVGEVSLTQSDPDARFYQGVVRHADVSGTSISDLQTLSRGGTGDGRASSANALIDEFLGDYNQVSATNAGAVALYITGQNSDQCQAINDYRDSLVNEVQDGTAAAEAPAPTSACGTDNRFGNTDIYGLAASDPTP